MRRRLRVSLGRFRRYVRRAMAALPPHFRSATDNVVVVVEAYPEAADYGSEAERAERAERGPLFGVYRGVPLPLRPAAPNLSAPDVIAVFRRPLLAACRTRRRLKEEIRLTVLHEMGHYFGLEEAAVEHL
jgi:predicted Zn-dependent protease with MMP-like domain